MLFLNLKKEKKTKINKTKSWFCEISRVYNPVDRRDQGKKEIRQMINYKSEEGGIDTDAIDIKMIMRECFEQHYANKFDNVDEMEKSFKDTKY